MLVPCRVKYSLDLMGGKDTPHRVGVGEILNTINDGRRDRCFTELHLQIEDAGFILVEADEFRWFVLQNLTT